MDGLIVWLGDICDYNREVCYSLRDSKGWKILNKHTNKYLFAKYLSCYDERSSQGCSEDQVSRTDNPADFYRKVTGERLAHLCNETYRSKSTSHVGTEIRCRNEQLMQTWEQVHLARNWGFSMLLYLWIVERK